MTEKSSAGGGWAVDAACSLTADARRLLNYTGTVSVELLLAQKSVFLWLALRCGCVQQCDCVAKHSTYMLRKLFPGYTRIEKKYGTRK